MLDDGNPLRVFLIIWGPWLVIAGIGSLLLLAAILFMRSTFLRRGDEQALKSMYVTILSGASALAGSLWLAYSLSISAPDRLLLPLGFSLLAGIAFLGFGTFTIWRLIGRMNSSLQHPAP